jgi:hypothetical protein
MRLAMLFSALCLTLASAFAEPEKPDVVRDGSTVERAVIVRQSSVHKVVAWEWQWIKEHHPFASALSWMHQSVCEHNRLYDLYILKTQAGERRAYFDVGEKCD